LKKIIGKLQINTSSISLHSINSLNNGWNFKLQDKEYRTNVVGIIRSTNLNLPIFKISSDILIESNNNWQIFIDEKQFTYILPPPLDIPINEENDFIEYDCVDILSMRIVVELSDIVILYIDKYMFSFMKLEFLCKLVNHFQKPLQLKCPPEDFKVLSNRICSLIDIRKYIKEPEFDVTTITTGVKLNLQEWFISFFLKNFPDLIIVKKGDTLTITGTSEIIENMQLSILNLILLYIIVQSY